MLSAAQPLTRNPFAALPNHNGVLQNMWSNGEPKIMQDRSPGSAGDLFGFGWSDKTYLYTTDNQGASWTIVDPLGAETIGTATQLCAAQDAGGKVHILFKNGATGRVDYARISLTHAAGHISGFSSEVKGVQLPGSYNTNMDIRGVLRVVKDQGGSDVLIYHVNDHRNPGFQLRMGQATSLSPMGTADFVALDGSAGSTWVYETASFNNHDHSSLFAGLPSNGDLWVAIAPIDAEYGTADGVTDLFQIRLTAVAPRRWTVGPAQSIVAGEGPTTELLCMAETPDHAWLMYIHPTEGVTFDRFAADGTRQHQVIPTPEAHRNMQNGWGVFSVSQDESRVYVILNTLASTGTPMTTQSFWDGSAWTKFGDTPVGDSWGMGGSLDWGDGVAAVILHESGAGLLVSTIHGGGQDQIAPNPPADLRILP
jgi:hypothetical protein